MVMKRALEDRGVKTDGIPPPVVRVGAPLPEIVAGGTEGAQIVVAGFLSASAFLDEAAHIFSKLLALRRADGGLVLQNPDGEAEAMHQLRRVVEAENVRKPNPAGLEDASQSHVVGVVVDDRRLAKPAPICSEPGSSMSPTGGLEHGAAYSLLGAR